MIKKISMFIACCSCAFSGEIDSREEHVQRVDQDDFKKTVYVMKRMNALMSSIEALKQASDQEIEKYCLEKNLNLEDVKYVINR